MAGFPQPPRGEPSLGGSNPFLGTATQSFLFLCASLLGGSKAYRSLLGYTISAVPLPVHPLPAHPWLSIPQRPCSLPLLSITKQRRRTAKQSRSISLRVETPLHYNFLRHAAAHHFSAFPLRHTAPPFLIAARRFFASASRFFAVAFSADPCSSTP